MYHKMQLDSLAGPSSWWLQSLMKGLKKRSFPAFLYQSRQKRFPETCFCYNISEPKFVVCIFLGQSYFFLLILYYFCKRKGNLEVQWWVSKELTNLTQIGFHRYIDGSHNYHKKHSNIYYISLSSYILAWAKSYNQSTRIPFSPWF